MKDKTFHFSGYATKFDVKCSDGRVIKSTAFKHQNGTVVPLVWQHLYNEPANILGHAVLEHRADGVYAYGVFNDTPAAQNAKALVEHGDITSLSIHANELKQKGTDVLHGKIRELSLVLAGANPGAVIENISISHSDGSFEEDETEAIIHSGTELEEMDDLHHADERTIGEIFEEFTEEQKEVVYAMLAHALESNELDHSFEGGSHMKQNVFDSKEQQKTNTLTHDQFKTILDDANRVGSLKEAILMHATTYGIENIDYLFPDAQTLKKDPDWLTRENDWVDGVLAAISKSPFSRVKSLIADTDFETARAKGYVKATEKKEVYFKMAKRVTTPTTVYVKQKLDRDDMIDVVDFDVVAMIRYQLRLLLNEELAQAILLGDGRDVADPYKINEENIRPIWKEDDMFAVKETVTTKTDYKKLIKEIAFSDENYKGSGMPNFYTTAAHRTGMLWVEDTTGRRIYESEATLCAALGVNKIVVVPQIAGKTRTVDTDTHELIGIKVNLKDYNMGADKGGQIATFDDFDIDFNQYKYLMETRASGALVKPKSAQIYEFVTQG